MNEISGVVCVVLSNFSRPSLESVLKEINSQATHLNQSIEILLLDTRAKKSNFEPAFTNYFNSISVPVHHVLHPFDGFASSRKAALKWILEHRHGHSALFIDDDDVPAPGCLQGFTLEYARHPKAILTGRVIRYGDAIPVNRRWLPRISKISGASLMWIPPELIFSCIEWLPERLNFSGGEDTSICIRATEKGIPIISIPNSIAFEEKSYSILPESQAGAKLFHESWVFSSIYFHESYKNMAYLFFRATILLSKSILRLTFQPRVASIKIAAFILGVFLPKPPPRIWKWSAHRQYLLACVSRNIKL